VVIKFIVEADGTLSCPQFVYRTDIEFENEALKVWRLFPRFKPAIKGGRPVRCWFVVPIRFKGL
jgi:tonB family C-terminal domain protein